MQITMTLLGTLGEIQPYVALGVGLQAAGQRVRIATHPEFAQQIRRHGLEFSPIRGNLRALLATAEARTMLNAGRHPFGFIRRVLPALEPLLGQWLGDFYAASAQSDAVLVSGAALLVGGSAAEARGLPLIPAFFVPLSPTSAFPEVNLPALPPWMPLRGRYNRLSHRLAPFVTRLVLRPMLNRLRQSVLKLPPIPHDPFWPLRDQPIVYGFSPTIVPRPADWGPRQQITGQWFLDAGADWQPPSELAAFLQSGPPPVYVGFGSMSDRDPAATTALVIEALAIARLRGVVCTGWGGMAPADLPPTIIQIPAAPHDWLYPRMAAVVHHGGAGTTAAALRAGVPALAVPYIAEQGFWGRRIAELGAGVAPIPRQRLSAENLALAMHQLTTSAALDRRASELGVRIRAEDGIGCAVALIAQQII